MRTPLFHFWRLDFLFWALVSLSLPLFSYTSKHLPHITFTDEGNRWINQSYFETPCSIDFAFNIGLGLLYFYKTQGNLTPIPPALFSNFSGIDFKEINRLGYNRTPVFEAQIGYLIFPWLRASMGYEGQSGLSVESSSNNAISSTTQRAAWACFRSNLQLNSLPILLEAQLPWALRLSHLACTPYMAIGIGPAWQTWSAPTVYLATTTQANLLTSSIMPLNQKITARILFTTQWGISFKPMQKRPLFSLQLGCKYVDWGASGSIGVQQQQASKIAPFKPISIRKIYSFIPFIGLQFNF